MSEISQIQTLINQRADTKLKNEIAAMRKFMLNGVPSILLDGIQFNVGTADKPQLNSLKYMFDSSNYLYDLIIEKHSERYREEETKLFLSEIDQLKSHLSELTERIDEISA